MLFGGVAGCACSSDRPALLGPLFADDEPTMGPTAMEESDSAGRASLAVAAAAAVAYVL